MDPFQDECICSLCGEKGVTHVGNRKFSWTSNFRHADPTVCAEVLKKKLQETEASKCLISPLK
jgi:hypothetical protein